jgi:hypothetical protein
MPEPLACCCVLAAARTRHTCARNDGARDGQQPLIARQRPLLRQGCLGRLALRLLLGCCGCWRRVTAGCRVVQEGADAAVALRHKAALVQQRRRVSKGAEVKVGHRHAPQRLQARHGGGKRRPAGRRHGGAACGHAQGRRRALVQAARWRRQHTRARCGMRPAVHVSPLPLPASPGPSHSRNASPGTPKRNACCSCAGAGGGGEGALRRHTSRGPASPRCMTRMTARPWPTLRANTVRQSSAAHAGTTPVWLMGGGGGGGGGQPGSGVGGVFKAVGLPHPAAAPALPVSACARHPARSRTPVRHPPTVLTLPSVPLSPTQPL